MRIFILHKNEKEVSANDLWKVKYSFLECMRHEVTDVEVVAERRFDKIANLVYYMNEGDYIAIIEPSNNGKPRETTYVEVTPHFCSYLLLNTHKTTFKATKQYSREKF